MREGVCNFGLCYNFLQLLYITMAKSPRKQSRVTQKRPSTKPEQEVREGVGGTFFSPFIIIRQAQRAAGCCLWGNLATALQPLPPYVVAKHHPLSGGYRRGVRVGLRPLLEN